MCKHARRRSVVALCSALVMGSAASAFGSTPTSYIDLLVSWNEFSPFPEANMFVYSNHNLNPLGEEKTIPDANGIAFWPATAYGAVYPAVSGSPGYAQTRSVVNNFSNEWPAKSSASAGAVLSPILNTSTNEIWRVTMTVDMTISAGSGDSPADGNQFFQENYYRAIVFGNEVAWDTSIRVPGAIVISEEDGYADTSTLTWLGEAIPWGFFTRTRTQAVDFLLYPGQSVTPTMSASTLVSMQETYQASAFAKVQGPVAPLAVQTVGTVYDATPTVADTNWSALGAPNAPCALVSLGARSGDTRIALTSPTTAGRIAFNSPVGKYTIDGPETLTLACGSGNVGFDVLAGQHTISAPLQVNNNFSVLTSGDTDSLTITTSSVGYASGIAFTKSGSGSLSIPNLPTGRANIIEGLVTITGTNPVRVTSIDIGDATPAVGDEGTLDLVDRDMIVDYTGASPKTRVVSLLAKGRANNWHGTGGIAASAADASLSTPTPHMRALGYAEASQLGVTTFAGQAVDSTAVLIKYTFNGDATLDEYVNFDDLLVLSQNYNLRGKTWTDADFTYDGLVDFDDLLALSQNYGVTGTPRGGSALARSLGANAGSSGLQQLVWELEAGAPWILEDALSHPEGTALFGAYVSDDAAIALSRGYGTQLQNYGLTNALVPEPMTVLTLAPAALLRRRRAV